jgi:hypothetical protein
MIGDAALWLPPRWWSYAAEHQPDGTFKDYSAPELANLLGYQGNVQEMMEALIQSGFADADPLRIHDWQDYNGYHKAFSERGRKGADARWQKERSKEKGTEKRGEEKRGEEKSQALLQASPSNACSIGDGKSQQMLGKSPLPLPSQLADLIREQKAVIKNTAFDDERQDAFHEKLWELEIQKYGAKKSKRKTATFEEKEEIPPMSMERRKELWARAKLGLGPDRNAGTFNAGMSTDDLKSKVR